MATVIAGLEADDDATDALPAVLARACVQVLPVAGAGISSTNQLRVPLGASDSTVVRAERLQTTLGEGPCLTATSTSMPVRATASMMASRWPVFHQELLRQTPYRTIVSLPLQSHQRLFAALDLYSTDEVAFAHLALDEIQAEVADPLASMLVTQPHTTEPGQEDLPAWLDSGRVRERMKVWVSIGMLMETGLLTNTEALSVLRAYAYTHDTTLDELAAQLTTRQVSVDTVLDS